MAVTLEIEVEVLGKSKLAFDEHAIKRMQERGVTQAQVIAALNRPNVTGLPTEPGRMRVRRHYGSHTAVDVVYEEEPDRIVVITVIRMRRP